MHNKLFIADGVMAVIGGRNIADEYFLRSETANFVDMDAFVMGAAVKELSSIFDRYWNSEVVYPIELIGEPLGDLEARRHARPDDREPAAGAADRPADAPTCSATARSARTSTRPDRPAVGHRPRLRRPAREAALGDAEGRVRDQRHQRRDDAGVAGQERARHHLAVHDPGHDGVASFENLQKNKVKVTVVTNSLAATDEPLVHNGYSKYRRRCSGPGSTSTS
jgi:putative cardiolipin synthase